MDTMMTYHGHVRNGQIAFDQPVRLPEGAEVTVRLMRNGNGATASRRQMLQLPMEQRREMLRQQSERASEIYQPDSERADWQGGFD